VGVGQGQGHVCRIGRLPVDCQEIVVIIREGTYGGRGLKL